MGFIACQSDEGYNLDLIQCLNDEVEILEDNTEEIEEISKRLVDFVEEKIQVDIMVDKINELVRAVNNLIKR